MTYSIMQSCMLLPLDLKIGECASWVQAWGSIFAIGGSVFVTRMQLRASAKRDASKFADSLSGIVELIEPVQGVAHQVMLLLTGPEAFSSEALIDVLRVVSSADLNGMVERNGKLPFANFPLEAELLRHYQRHSENLVNQIDVRLPQAAPNHFAHQGLQENLRFIDAQLLDILSQLRAHVVEARKNF